MSVALFALLALILALVAVASLALDTVLHRRIASLERRTEDLDRRLHDKHDRDYIIQAGDRIFYYSGKDGQVYVAETTGRYGTHGWRRLSEAVGATGSQDGTPKVPVSQAEEIEAER